MSREINYQISYRLQANGEVEYKIISALNSYDAKELFYEITPQFDKDNSIITSITNHIEPLGDDFQFPEPAKRKEKDYLYPELLEDNGWKWWTGHVYEKYFKNTFLKLDVHYHSVRIYEPLSPSTIKDYTLFYGKNVKTIEDLNFILNKIGVEEL